MGGTFVWVLFFYQPQVFVRRNQASVKKSKVQIKAFIGSSSNREVGSSNPARSQSLLLCPLARLFAPSVPCLNMSECLVLVKMVSDRQPHLTVHHHHHHCEWITFSGWSALSALKSNKCIRAIKIFFFPGYLNAQDWWQMKTHSNK